MKTSLLIVGILATVVVLVATAVPGTFIVDECNYLATTLAVRAGGWALPNTADLPASAALRFFDPAASEMALPVAGATMTAAPPWYGILTAPFLPFGWRALVALNAIGVVVAVLLVYRCVKGEARSSGAAAVAAVAVGFGGGVIEYAQGIWPHGMSLGLCTGGWFLVWSARRRGGLRELALAGLLLGIATGLRYQNVVFFAALAAVALFWHEKRWKAAAMLVIGAAPPLAVSAAVNATRLGVFNPITKGPGYLSTLAPGGLPGRGPLELFQSFWHRVVDHSIRPPFTGPAALIMPKDLETGAFPILTAVKKAWLQSSPWLGVVMLAVLCAWLVRARAVRQESRAELRALSLPIVALVALLTWSGLARHDGWSFNQRYFLELVPLCAIALGLLVARIEWRMRSLLLGGVLGLAWALPGVLSEPRSVLRLSWLMTAPALLTLAAVVSWLLVLRDPRFSRWLQGAIAAGLAWALVVHLGDDVRASRFLRSVNMKRLRAVAAVMPEGPIAIVAGYGLSDALCPLQAHRDLLIVAPHINGGDDAGAVTDALLARHRRVLVLPPFSDQVWEALMAERQYQVLSRSPPILELTP